VLIFSVFLRETAGEGVTHDERRRTYLSLSLTCLAASDDRKTLCVELPYRASEICTREPDQRNYILDARWQRTGFFILTAKQILPAIETIDVEA